MKAEIINTIPVSDPLPAFDGTYIMHGESMAPKLAAGDIVCYKHLKSHRGVYFGQMYILTFIFDGDEQKAIKYIYQSEIEGHYTLVSHNADYSPFDIPIDCIVDIAHIKASFRFHAMM